QVGQRVIGICPWFSPPVVLEMVEPASPHRRPLARPCRRRAQPFTPALSARHKHQAKSSLLENSTFPLPPPATASVEGWGEGLFVPGKRLGAPGRGSQAYDVLQWPDDHVLQVLVAKVGTLADFRLAI